jgi:type IV secretory pathway VirB2 component (pilin)
MGGLSLIQFAQTLAQFITGPFGISVIVLAVAGTFLAAALHMLPARAGFVSFVCGAMAFAAAWLVQQFIGAGGGI